MTDMLPIRRPPGHSDRPIGTSPDLGQVDESKPFRIILAMDSDEAGQAANFRGVDIMRNIEADPEGDDDRKHNPTWVKLPEDYADYQSLLLDLGIGTGTPKPKDGHWWVDPQAIRGWPILRLALALERWQAVQLQTLYFGNAYLIKFVLPQAELRIKELRDELVRRATPRLVEQNHAKNVRDYWDAETVRSQVDAIEIYTQLLPDLEQVGGKYRARCPFHKNGAERTPSLIVYPDGGRWHCYGGCGTGGSVFDLVMRLENLPFAEAVNRVAELGHMGSKPNG